MALVSLGQHNLGNIYSRTWNLGVFKGKISEIMISKKLKSFGARCATAFKFFADEMEVSALFSHHLTSAKVGFDMI